MLWQSFVHHTKFCYFWKDRERRFLGTTDGFLKFYGFRTEQEIIGKTDKDMNWHLDNNSYRLDEIEVIQKCRVIENVAGLHNRQGFLGDLLQYQETYAIEKQPYMLILLESRFDERIQKSYGSLLLRALIRKEASILRNLVRKDSVIARVQHAMFAILRRENGQKDAATQKTSRASFRAICSPSTRSTATPSPSPSSTASSTRPILPSTRPPTAMSATSTAWRWSGCAVAAVANKKSRNILFLDFGVGKFSKQSSPASCNIYGRSC